MKHLIVERLAKVQVLMIFHHQLLNAVIKTFNPIKHVFSLSLKQGIFPENLKIARVSPIFKKDEKFLPITDLYQCYHVSLNCWRK